MGKVANDLTLPSLALAFALFALYVTWTNPPKEPTVLVGYGCEGSDGKPLYFPEEDMFPNCSLIERSK